MNERCSSPPGRHTPHFLREAFAFLPDWIVNNASSG
jgi:hypothetical protein